MKKLFFVLIILIVGCKSETKESPIENEQAVVAEQIKELKVVVNFKTNKEDEFKLLLNNVPVDEFQRKNVHVIEKVLPTTGTETITATFGENNISPNFNFNFGVKENKEVEIESISMSYGANTVTMSGAELSEYFTINKYLTQDSITNKLTTQRIDGKYYPAMILRRKAYNALTKE